MKYLIDEDVRKIFEDWYGDELENLENDSYIVNYLVKPISKLVAELREYKFMYEDLQ